MFAALSDDVASCRVLVEDARRRAEEEMETARGRAAAILARARLESDARRAGAAQSAERSGSAQDAHLLERAAAEAATLKDEARRQMPSVVAVLLDRIVAYGSTGPS
ncbi:hypothetical protein [uncultured Kocuria sp.]|uniref:hypothetical protein n=1 Tax=uncultured Kocuria sp. TaxID=259305 RepID=UPI002625B585|nr:hypothetical protein [uncultured Kocuria sp.]